MAAERGIDPQDVLAPVQALLRQRAGEWVSPRWLWQQLAESDPRLAREIERQISAAGADPYPDPEAFVSATLQQLRGVAGYTLSDVEEFPELRGETTWLIARAER